MSLDALAERIYQAVQDDRFAEALEMIEGTISDRTDRPLLHARLLAWEGQSWLGLNQLERAQQSILKGMSLARRTGDKPGVRALQGLHRNVLARMAALKPPPLHQPTLLSEAQQAFDKGELETGAELARRALHKARSEDDPREQVLALLALARSPALAQDAVLRAHRVAQDSEDSNLVSAVARAASAAQVELPAHVF